MPTREQMHSLVQEISGAHQARAAGNVSLRREVIGWLRAATRGRNTQTQQLRAELIQTAAQRRAGVAGWLHEVAQGRSTQARQLQADLAQTAAQRRAGVAGWLHEVAQGRSTQAQQLQADLAQTAAQRRAGVAGWLRAATRGRNTQTKQLRAELAQTAARRRAGVAGWLRAVTRDHAGAQREWQQLARMMHPRSTNGAAPAEETRTEQRKAAGEAMQELTALAGGVFQYLADRPDGAPLVEIEKEIQLDRFGAVRALKRLMDDGKAEKRGRLYFAA